jgi:hypothetical protein
LTAVFNLIGPAFCSSNKARRRLIEHFSNRRY